MKKLILTCLLALMSFATFSKDYVFTSYYWGAFKRTEYSGRYDEETFSSKVTITIDENWVVIRAGDIQKIFLINNTEVNSDLEKGVYYYCNNGMLVNVYRMNGQTKIMTIQNNQYFWFSISSVD
jgi:hypothetical protein